MHGKYDILIELKNTLLYITSRNNKQKLGEGHSIKHLVQLLGTNFS